MKTVFSNWASPGIFCIVFVGGFGCQSELEHGASERVQIGEAQYASAAKYKNHFGQKKGAFQFGETFGTVSIRGRSTNVYDRHAAFLSHHTTLPQLKQWHKSDLVGIRYRGALHGDGVVYSFAFKRDPQESQSTTNQYHNVNWELLKDFESPRAAFDVFYPFLNHTMDRLEWYSSASKTYTGSETPLRFYTNNDNNLKINAGGLLHKNQRKSHPRLSRLEFGKKLSDKLPEGQRFIHAASRTATGDIGVTVLSAYGEIVGYYSLDDIARK